MKNPKVSIIILNWNGWKDTIECINSINKISYPNYEIIVVDNASYEEDIKILKNRYKNKIRLIVNDKNYGFAKGNNIAIKQVLRENKSKYILLLNNDTIVDSNFLNELVKVGESDENIVILGPKMYYYNFNNKKNVIWFGGGSINWRKYPGYHHIDQFKEDNKKLSMLPIKTQWISGACMMVNTRLISPLLNEKYYFGCEDIDKCLSLNNKYKIVYVPKAMIWHKVGRSRKKSMIQNFKGNLTNFKLIKNNNSLWIFLIPYFFAIILIKFILKNTKRLLFRDKK